MNLSTTEENYLKALFHITSETEGKHYAGTNELASYLNIKPASVNDMLKRLKEKQLVENEKYGKIQLTSSGKSLAVQIVRKHRLWETFLYEKLNFSWDEVHEVAEQLEHIDSPKLIEQLEKFLGYPEFDPHGDYIPTASGEIKKQKKTTLANIEVGKKCKLVAVKDSSASFLQYLVKIGLGISSEILVVGKQEFDSSIEIEVNQQRTVVSQKFSESVYVI